MSEKEKNQKLNIGEMRKRDEKMRTNDGIFLITLSKKPKNRRRKQRQKAR